MQAQCQLCRDIKMQMVPEKHAAYLVYKVQLACQLHVNGMSTNRPRDDAQSTVPLRTDLLRLASACRSARLPCSNCLARCALVLLMSPLSSRDEARYCCLLSGLTECLAAHSFANQVLASRIAFRHGGGMNCSVASISYSKHIVNVGIWASKVAKHHLHQFWHTTQQCPYVDRL